MIIRVLLKNVLAKLEDSDRKILAQTVLAELPNVMEFTRIWVSYDKSHYISDNFRISQDKICYFDIESLINIELSVYLHDDIEWDISRFIGIFINMRHYFSEDRFNAKMFQGLEQEIMFNNTETGEADLISHLSTGIPARCSTNGKYHGANVLILSITTDNLNNVCRENYPNLRILICMITPKIVINYEVSFDDDEIILNRRDNFNTMDYLIAMSKSSIKCAQRN